MTNYFFIFDFGYLQSVFIQKKQFVTKINKRENVLIIKKQKILMMKGLKLAHSTGLKECTDWKKWLGSMNKYRVTTKTLYRVNIFELRVFPAGIYVFKVSHRNTRARCEICSMLTIKTPDRRHCLVLVFLLLTLSR